MSVFKQTFFNICNKAIHCEWDEWIVGECTRSCGTGTRINNRTKLVEEAHGGTCNGQPQEIVECNTQPCPGMILLPNHLNM